MKKILSLAMIAAVAATMFTSCKDGDKPDSPPPPNPAEKATLSLSVEKATLKAGETSTFTVTSDIAAPADIIITVKSSAIAFVTVVPTVTIKAGAKTITGTYVAIAGGKATISIEAQDVTLSVASKEVTVDEEPAPEAAEVEKLIIEPVLSWNGYFISSDDKTVLFNFHEVSYDPNKGSIALDFGAGNTIGVGTLNNKGYLCLTPQATGTVIKFDDMKSPKTERPMVWSGASMQNHTALATGEDVYIAVACGNQTSTADDYRAWIKINLKPAGGWASLTVLEAYICRNKGEFKVGQTK